jgi:hypothetical protein
LAPWQDEKAVLSDAWRKVAAFREFDRLFPENVQSFSSGSVVARALLFQRYELRLTLGVMVGDDKRTIRESGTPSFQLQEITRVDGVDGAALLRAESRMEFGPVEWQKVVDAKGDLSVLGVETVKDQPVVNLDAYWKAQTNRWERVQRGGTLTLWQKEMSVLADARPKIVELREFEELFPDHALKGAFGRVEARTILHLRYDLKMTIHVKVNEDDFTVSDPGTPSFELYEVTRASGVAGAWGLVSQPRLEFGRAEWRKVVAARGDFSVLGVQLVKDQPVPNLDAYWKTETDEWARVQRDGALTP